MRGDDGETGNRGLLHRQGFPCKDRAVEGLVRRQFLVVVTDDLGGIGLGVGVDQQDFFALTGESCSEGDAGGSFASATFLGCNGNDHSANRSEAGSGYSDQIFCYIYCRTLCLISQQGKGERGRMALGFVEARRNHRARQDRSVRGSRCVGV